MLAKSLSPLVLVTICVCVFTCVQCFDYFFAIFRNFVQRKFSNVFCCCCFFFKNQKCCWLLWLLLLLLLRYADGKNMWLCNSVRDAHYQTAVRRVRRVNDFECGQRRSFSRICYFIPFRLKSGFLWKWKVIFFSTKKIEKNFWAGKFKFEFSRPNLFFFF